MEALDFLMWYTPTDIQALMVAAVKRGDMRIIKYMHRELDKGVNGDFECLVKAWPYGVTPLHIAAGGHRHIQVLQWLHEMTGMDLDTRDKEQRSPLHHALLTGADRSVSWLIERRANIEATDGCGTTPLMYAAKNDACAGMRMLLRARAKIEATDDRGWSALMHAAEDNHEVCIQQLIDAGAKVNRKSVDGFTALMLACENGQFNRALLSAPADIDERNTTTGSTALMLAAAYGHASCTLALLDQGASHSIQNFKGDTALSLAQKGRHKDCIYHMQGEISLTIQAPIRRPIHSLSPIRQRRRPIAGCGGPGSGALPSGQALHAHIQAHAAPSAEKLHCRTDTDGECDGDSHVSRQAPPVRHHA